MDYLGFIAFVVALTSAGLSIRNMRDLKRKNADLERLQEEHREMLQAFDRLHQASDNEMMGGDLARGGTRP